jgi:hypothetical protein
MVYLSTDLQDSLTPSLIQAIVMSVKYIYVCKYLQTAATRKIVKGLESTCHSFWFILDVDF